MSTETSIAEEVQHRAKACRHFGPIFDYVVPPDAFKHPTVQAFKKAHPFVRETKSRKNCIVIRPDIKPYKDEHGRYYTHARHPQQCKTVNGVYDPTSYNRAQPPLQGVCWTSPQEAKCGARVKLSAVLKKNGRRIDERVVKKAKADCEQGNTCAFVKLGDEGGRDCVTLELAQKLKTTVHEPPANMPAYITTPASRISEYLYRWYAKAIPTAPPTTVPLKGTGNRCNVTKDAKGMPTLPQSVVNMVMKRIAMAGDKTSSRGLLAWHSTGAGKTCTATGVIDAFWNSGRDIIYVSSVDALASNPPSTFYDCAYNMFPRFVANEFEKDTALQTKQEIARQFKEKSIRFMSFAKLANRVKKTVRKEKLAAGEAVDLNNAVLIIDEVHNLFRPLSHQKKQHEYLLNQIADPTRFPRLKIVILTATPGDTVNQVVRLLNIVRDPTKPPIKAPKDDNGLEAFKKSIYGLVSYFDMSHDYTRFPKVVEAPVVRRGLSDKQLAKYLEAYQKMTPAHLNYDNLAEQNKLQKYASPARKYANAVFQFEKDMLVHEFSAKLPALLEAIRKQPREKHYVYSSFYENRGYGGQGILAIAKFLESELGYTQMTVEEAAEWEEKGELPPKGVKRYVLAIQKQIGVEGTGSAGQNLQRLVRLFNHNENARGEVVHVFLASQSFNEGLDLKAVRHVHFFEPLVTMASDIQTVGRAVRNCSHRDLEMSEWDVTVHRYMIEGPSHGTDSPKQVRANIVAEMAKIKAALETTRKKYRNKDKRREKERGLKARLATLKRTLSAKKGGGKGAHDAPFVNIEEVIYEQARERVKDMMNVYGAMREAAIDCRVLADFHDARVQCM